MSTEEVEIGLGYVKTIPGILKIAQEVVNFLGMVCLAASHPHGRADAFLACSIMALILTALLLICYITQIVVKFQIPWYKIEFIYCVIFALFYLIVSSLVVTVKLGGYIAGGVFGYGATVLYAGDAFYKFRLVTTV